MSEGVSWIAGPLVLAWRRNHAGSNGILLNVPQTREPVPLVLDSETAVPSIPERADAFLPLVEIPNVTAIELLHHFRQATIRGRRSDQMVVSRHQHETVKVDAEVSSRSSEYFQEMLTI